MTTTNGAAKPSMNEANPKDPFTAAYANGEVLINSDERAGGRFFMPGGAPNGKVFGESMPSDASFRAFVILSELGHAIGRFKPDARDQGLMATQHSQVIYSCFRGKD